MSSADPAAKKPKIDEPPFLGPNEALGGVSVGDEAEWERTVLLEHVEKYSEVTGDRNPLHFDKGTKVEAGVVVRLLCLAG